MNELNNTEIYHQLHKSKEPIALTAKLASSRATKAKRTEVQEVVAALTLAIKRHKTGTALSSARTLLVLQGADAAMATVKRFGVFRPSTYEFKAPSALKVLQDWISQAAIYNLSSDDVNYLTSTQALWCLASGIHALSQSILSRLRKLDAFVIKTLLAEVDYAFTYGRDERNERYNITDLDNPEEMSEAFSYLLHQFHQHIGLKKKHFGALEDQAGYSPKYLELLSDAAKICRYRAAEVLLEAFPYTAQEDALGARIRAIDPLLEKSLRLGYIQAQMQSNIRRAEATAAFQPGHNPNSIVHYAEQLFQEYGDQMFELAEYPARRYRLVLPKIDASNRFFSDNHTFIEDEVTIEMLAIEDYIAPKNVIHANVINYITVLDILKLQRFFMFLHVGLRHTIERHRPYSEMDGLYMASCLPVFRRENLIEALTPIIGPNVEALLDLLTCDLQADYIDLQYAPIIEADGCYMLSMAVLANSNLVRNLLCRNNRRLTLGPNQEEDPMQSSLKRALITAGFLVQEEFKLKSGGQNKFEVDLLAYKDGHLFLFECKNAYHPCNVYESRNSYDHIVKAGGQLGLRRTWISDLANQQRVLDKLSWKVTASNDVHTCIATGNRVFHGFASEGHPVRQVHEMINMLVRGYSQFSGMLGTARVRLWRDKTFGVSDFCAYLNGTTTVADMLGAMQPNMTVTRIGSKALMAHTFTMDMLRLREISLSRYPCIDDHGNVISGS